MNPHRLPVAGLPLVLLFSFTTAAAVSESGPTPASFAPDFSASTTYRWTENINRASGRADFRDAGEYGVNLNTGINRQLSSRLYSRLDLSLSAVACPEYQLRDLTEFGPHLTVKRKFGLGPMAPVLSAEADVTGRVARLQGQNGVGARGSLGLSKRFTAWLAASVSGEWKAHEAANDVFSVSHFSGDARIIIDPHPRVRFTAGIGRLDGSFTASASRNRYVNGALAGALGPQVASYFANVPWYQSDIYSPAWVSYRVRGYVESWWFEVSPAITDRTGISLRYERNYAESVVRTSYRQDIVTVSLDHAF